MEAACHTSTIADCFSAFYADGLTGYEVKIVMLRGRKDERLDLEFLPADHPPIDIRQCDEHFDEFIRENPGYFYIFSLDGFRGEKRDKLMAALEQTQSEYAIIPPIRRLHLHGMEPHYFFGNDVMLLHKKYNLAGPFGRFFKRAMDLIVSGAVLLILVPLTVIIWLSKRMEGSDTPVFYGGDRVGMNGRLFPCWKFCTMKRNADALLQELMDSDPQVKAEWEKYKKLKNDPRIDSKISLILRKTSLDELPQIWNVFLGDMSLVGPRPILPEQQKDYGDALSQYISTRPGLTGLWQVSGRNQTSFEQRIMWDSWYIRNWSLWHDIVILFKTVQVLFQRSGAY
jgi:undecaprenyl-phosphate galactose phosphotransferase